MPWYDVLIVLGIFSFFGAVTGLAVYLSDDDKHLVEYCWRPLDTAPKDGTYFDVLEFCHSPEWRPDAHGISSGMRICDVHYSEGRLTGLSENGEYYHLPINKYYTVSHWVPILAPPSDDR
jgi:hypothetical protein